MGKTLTISVAAYNVAQYLDQLMQSVIDSGVLEKIEVLIINDGSQDETADKALVYQQRYPDSVRLISKENGGHGSTINRGIREAKGAYFRTLDGDDWVHSEHLKGLVETAAGLDVDLILSDYRNCYADGREEIVCDFPKLEKGRTYSFDELQEKVEWMRYHAVVYRTALLQEHAITLDEKCFYVDSELMLFPIPYVDTVYYFKDPVYCYRLGLTEQSVSRESRQKHIADGKKVSDSLLKYYGEVKPRLSESKRAYFIEGVSGHCLFHFKSLMMFPPSRKQKQEILFFEKTVRESDGDVFLRMGQKGERSRMLLFLRRTHYAGYGLMCRYKRIAQKLPAYRK